MSKVFVQDKAVPSPTERGRLFCVFAGIVPKVRGEHFPLCLTDFILQMLFSPFAYNII